MDQRRRADVVSSDMLVAGDGNGTTVLLIDDLIASGDTVRRAAVALRRVGARSVVACAAQGTGPSDWSRQLHSGLTSSSRPEIMDILILLTLLAAGAFALKSRDQNRRIALLGSHLERYRIENLMERLTQGYLRALGEPDPQRRDQIWNLLAGTEIDLCEQFNLFAAEFSKVDAKSARVSKIAIALPFADRIFSSATFDLRQALSIHSQGIAEAVKDRPGLTPNQKAFILQAEMFLMQHTCHWFCRSKIVASARMLRRHQTTYAQALASVSPATRQAYGRLVGN